MKRKITKLLILLSLLLTVPQLRAQSVLIKGLVVDAGGNPLPGVSIIKKNSTIGTTTTLDGKYVLNNLSPGDTLEYNYVGFEKVYKVVGNNTVINVILKEAASELGEVQVVAFQTQKRESVIGSINTIRPSELKIAPTNMTNALAGKIAGIISYQRSGEPGQDNAEFFVRGVTTFGYKSSPLILIDGLEVSTNDLARMEPDNIASFSIMKDATATALYGARGANGVILVTTKTGVKGKANVSVRIDNSFTSPTRTNKFLGGVQYMELYNEALRTREPSALLYYSKDKIEGTRRGTDSQIYPNIDWYDALFRDYVMNQKANININGGGEVAQYYLSASYTDEMGLLKVDNLNNFNNNVDIKRYNLQANIDINLTKTTKVAVKFSSLIDRYNGPVVDASSIFEEVMQANPVNFPMYYEKDASTQYLNHVLFGNKGDGTYPNPYADMVKGFKNKFTSSTRSQFQVEQDLGMITKGLKIRGLASVSTYSSNENSREFTPFYYGLKEVDTDAGVEHSLYQITEGTEYLKDPTVFNEANSSFYFEAATQYNRAFNTKHEVGGLLVFTAKEALNTIAGSALASLPSRNMGVSGRATYAFDSRYFTEVNFGYNGSEKFAAEHRFGFFPSAGIGWAVSNEKFWTSELKNKISLLKFKATYGLVGNDAISAASDRFFYLSAVNLSNSNYGYSYGNDFSNFYNGYIIDRYSNPDITWEVSAKANYGLELGLFNKVNIQVDYFTENRSNIYMSRDYIPETMGLTASISSNLGRVKSHGVDASVDYNVSINKDWWVTSRANFTYSTNEVIENGEPDYQYDYLSQIGQSINQQWGYVAERLFVDEEDVLNSPTQFNIAPGTPETPGTSSLMAGDIKYVDVNEDGKIDENDRVPIGYPTVPEIIYGFGISTGFHDFDFSFFFQGSARSSFFIDPTAIAPFVNERNALQIIADNHWSDDNPDPNAFWPRLSTTSIENNEKVSTWWLRDGSFLRLKSVELGYSLPEKLIKKFSFSKARFYASGTNLFVISKFKLWDPEMGSNGLGYPTQKVINLGLNVNF
ncbi:MAG: TonB-dependent receptor [Paludibacter sp.]|nr:TonB-dependent receptor [Paludibacter sp.]